MSWTIIVASSDGAQLEALVEGAEQIKARIGASSRVSILTAASVEDVQKWRNFAADRRQLLIIAATLPYQQSSPDRNAEPGLELIKSVAQEPDPPTCILVSERTEHYRIVQGLKRCEWLMVDNCTNYPEQCVALARKLAVLDVVPVVPSPPINTGAAPHATSNAVLLEVENVAAQQADRADKPFALLEVDLHDARRGIARLDIGGAGRIARGDSCLLEFKEDELNQLLKKSETIRNKLSKALASDEAWKKYYARWPTEYRAIGMGFAKLLWDTPFRDLYHEGIGVARGNVRLRFNLEGRFLDGLWEAMLDARFKDPLMVQNTIARRARPAYGGRAQQTIDIGDALSDDGNEIGVDNDVLRVLVIKSDVPNGCSPVGPGDLFWQKFWDRQKGTLPNLPDLDLELAVLRLLQEPREGAGAARRVYVRVLERPMDAGVDWSLADEVKRELKGRGSRYDIVHFAGHALFATDAKGKDRRGYLIFSTYDGARAVPIATVASWLQKARVQLVYLSCCRSSARSVELEFARYNVPMTIGFNWDLDDSKAVDFARCFYDALLENDLKVCVAMRQARSDLYDTYNVGDPIWASPVLVAQPTDWMQVEAVFRPAFYDGHAPSPPRPLPPGPRKPDPGSKTIPGPAPLHG